jgi:hypothetical protein
MPRDDALGQRPRHVQAAAAAVRSPCLGVQKQKNGKREQGSACARLLPALERVAAIDRRGRTGAWVIVRIDAVTATSKLSG